MARVMIVDDEKDIREMINLMITKEGYEAEMAEDELDFLNKVDDFQPDLVTLELRNSILKPQELVEKLKEKQCNPKIVLLTVMRYGEEEKKKILENENIVSHITKPFDLDDLIDSLKKNL